jgi:hypothetical protein
VVRVDGGCCHARTVTNVRGGTGEMLATPARGATAGGPGGPPAVFELRGAYGTVTGFDVPVAVTVGNPPETISFTFGSA